MPGCGSNVRTWSSESNYRTGLHLDTGASHSSIGVLELFGNDIADTSTYWNGLIEAAQVVVGTHNIIDNRQSAGGLKITGASTRVGDGVVRQTGNATSSAVGVDIDAASVSYKGKITSYNAAGQIGLRTSNTSARSYLDVEATIEDCYTGWSNVNSALAGSYKIRITTSNKDHLLFTGAGPGTFDLSAGGGVRARDAWDVIAVNTGTSHTGTAAAGASGSITLAAAASTRDEVYSGCIVTATGGTGSGQTRVVSGYVGSTKVASVTPSWAVTPDGTTTYSVATLNSCEQHRRHGNDPQRQHERHHPTRPSYNRDDANGSQHSDQRDQFARHSLSAACKCGFEAYVYGDGQRRSGGYHGDVCLARQPYSVT